jgi:hypothetical protein
MLDYLSRAIEHGDHIEAEVARLRAHTEATSPEGIGGTSGSLA